jgi:hypothetical protein
MYPFYQLALLGYYCAVGYDLLGVISREGVFVLANKGEL